MVRKGEREKGRKDEWCVLFGEESIQKSVSKLIM